MTTHRLFGFLYVALAALGWAALGSWVLLMPPSVDPLGFSGARGLVIALSFLWLSKRSGGLEEENYASSARISLVIAAGLAYGFASITYVASLGMIAVGVAAPLHYTSPLFLVIGTALVRRVLPQPYEVVGVVLGLAGSLVLLTDAPLGAWPGMITAVGSAVFWALYIAAQGTLTACEKNLSACTGGAVMFLFSLPWYHAGLLAPSIVALLLVAGIVSSTLPLVCLARASTTLAPSSISLLLLCEPALATVSAYLTSAQTIEPVKALGLGLITAGAASPLCVAFVRPQKRGWAS